MKITEEKNNIVLNPEDSYDYFLLGQIFKNNFDYRYDFERLGEERTIKNFRISKESLLNFICSRVKKEEINA